MAENCYVVDPETSQKKLLYQNKMEFVAEIQSIRDILEPYYNDINYASSDSKFKAAKLRSKTPDQLIQKFDPLPIEKLQSKIDFYFKPYYLKMNTRKYMDFSINDREEFLSKMKQKLNAPDIS